MEVNYGGIQFDGAGCELMVNERCDWMWGWNHGYLGVKISGQRLF